VTDNHTYLGKHFIFVIVESLCCTPETNACNEGEKRQQKEKKYDPWLPGMGMEDTQIIEDF